MVVHGSLDLDGPMGEEGEEGEEEEETRRRGGIAKTPMARVKIWDEGDEDGERGRRVEGQERGHASANAGDVSSSVDKLKGGGGAPRTAPQGRAPHVHVAAPDDGSSVGGHKQGQSYSVISSDAGASALRPPTAPEERLLAMLDG